MHAQVGKVSGLVESRHEGEDAGSQRAARVWSSRVKLTAPAASGLVRQRLLRVLDLRSIRVFFVTALPGSGKTTLLAQYVDHLRRRGPDHKVAWYHAEETDTSAGAITGYLTTALSTALHLPDAPSEDPAVLLAMLDSAGSGHLDAPEDPSVDLTVVVDDAHLLAGSQAERVLARAIAVSPPGVRFVVVGTQAPGMGFTRQLLAPDTLTLGEDDLRLRSWEVGVLFERHYGEPLPPEDVAALTRHTEGWAAGLHMFYLATAGKPLSARRRAVAGVGGRGRLVKAYLTATVLHRLPPHIADFVVLTSALTILHADLCDALLGRPGAAAILEELAERQLFTTQTDEITCVYRYHTALQVHLERILRERLGAGETRQWYARAGTLLEEAGFPTAALRAFFRAEDWPAVERVLREYGPDISTDATFPDEAFAIEGDPWVGLARAHRRLYAGDLAGAIAAYHDVERLAGETPAADLARKGRRSAEAWLPGGTVPVVAPSDAPWPLLLRTAVRQNPAALAPEHDDVGGAFVAALSTLLLGEPVVALRLAEQIDVHGKGFLALATQLLGMVAGLWAGTVTAAPLDSLAAEAEQAGQPWLARVARAAAAIAARAPAEAYAVRMECVRDGDEWGALLAALAAGIAELAVGGEPAEILEDAVDTAHRLEAGVLEAWARGLLAVALARGGAPTAELEAHRAEACAREAGVHAARALAFQALADCAEDGASEFHVLAAMSAAGGGLLVASDSLASDSLVAESLVAESLVPQRVAPERVVAQPVVAEPVLTTPERDLAAEAPALTLRCFGTFRIYIGDRELDLAGVRPRARAMLRMLACYAGQAVHEERLLDALWPGMSPQTGRRNLQVAVSALRRALEPAAARGRSQLLRRSGTAYLLMLPPGSQADVALFREAVTTWRVTRGGPPDRLRLALRSVLAAYGGDLLPEDGPAEWVVGEREELRSDAARAALALAELELASRDGVAAADAGEYAVRIDPFRDQGWRILLAAYQLTGDAAAAAQARRRYAVVLGELGIEDSAATA